MQQAISTLTEKNSAISESKKSNLRIESIDILRGLVMIIMALDHTRDFFHIKAWSDDPLNLATTTPMLFLTRWITHFCAPIFVFLAGSSAWFQSQTKSKKTLSSFLIKRGLWLILIEIILINFAFNFDPKFQFIGLQTIWAIGVSMIFLGLVIWLPFPAILFLAFTIVFGHNTLDFFEAKHTGDYPIFYSILHYPSMYRISDNLSVFFLYPVLPWMGLMLTGYCFGKLFTSYEGKQRRNILMGLGFGIIVFFIALRASNLYGNPVEWAAQKNLILSIFSFINTQKYPPSLLYMTMTIGPAILFIAWFSKLKNKITEVIIVFGRVPFFYYVLHFYLIHLVSMLFFLARGHSFESGIYKNNSILPNFIVENEGYSLGMVYIIWICIVALLYPCCHWFNEYKKTHKSWWLSYL